MNKKKFVTMHSSSSELLEKIRNKTNYIGLHSSIFIASCKTRYAHGTECSFVMKIFLKDIDCLLANTSFNQWG